MSGEQSSSSFSATHLKCDVCLEIKLNPTALPCGHTFCGPPRDCLEGLFVGAGYPRCAVCRKLFKIKRDQLHPLYGLKDFFQEVNEMQSPLAQGSASSTDFTNSAPKLVKRFCKCHENQSLEYFCYVCEEEICGQCWDLYHSDARKHGVQKISHAKKQSKIKDRMNDVNSKMEIIQGTIPVLEELLKKMILEYNYLIDQLVTCEQIQTMTFKELEILNAQARDSLESDIRSQILLLQTSEELSSKFLDESDLLRCKTILANIESLTVESCETEDAVTVKAVEDSAQTERTSSKLGFFDEILDKIRRIFE